MPKRRPPSLSSAGSGKSTNRGPGPRSGANSRAAGGRGPASNQARGGKPNSGKASAGKGTGRRTNQPNRRNTQQRNANQRRAPEHRRSSNLGGDQVEGRQAVRELLAANRRRTYEVLIAPLARYDATSDDADADDPDGGDHGASSSHRFSTALAEIADLAASRRVPVREVRANKLAELARTEAPQGVIARATPLEPTPLEQLSETTHGTPPLLVAVDGITDPANLGAIMRTAEVAGATGVVVPKHRAVRLTPAATKAAAGAIEHLPIALVSGLPAALAQLAEAGLWVVGLDSSAPTPLRDLAVASEPMVLVLGSEGRGLGHLVRRRCHQLVRIPRRGRLDSLNVAAAAAVALYEVDRARAVPSPGTPG